MTPESIKQIKIFRDAIREKLKNFDKAPYANQRFGGENEYDIDSLIRALEKVLSDIGTLVRSPQRFLQFSNHGERNNVLSHLKRINQYFNAPAHYYAQLDNLKIIVRNFQFHNQKEAFKQFQENIEELKELKIEVDNDVDEIQRNLKEINRARQSISNILENSNSLARSQEEDLESFNHQKNRLHDLFVQAGIDANEIKELRNRASAENKEVNSSVTEIKSNQKLISSFSKSIQDRTTELDKIKERADQIKDQLRNFDTTREKILQEGKELIEQARNAMTYSTAKGLSASFQNQYEEVGKNRYFWGWIVGAILFFGVTLYLGLIVLNTATTDLGLIIGRIALLPLPIIGAIFCANQYTKQKQLKEDYAYKTTISKAIVGFSDQLKKNGSEDNQEYIHYIKTSLEEIHKDPLRERGSKPKSMDLLQLDKLAEVAGKIVNLTKTQS